ncbi:B3 domain-containing protein At2g31720-like [Dillenia turbinata]|uniref:B3 domain-containing protein At2g31720-like n=1 Tax=Dillenia turbinata TaxID=194707 RepID=A0AAN8V9Q9_9MAGN
MKMVRTQKDILGKKTEDFEDPIHMLCFLLEHELEKMKPKKPTKIFRSKRLRNPEDDLDIDARKIKKQRKKGNRVVIDNVPNPAPDLPIEFKNAIAEKFYGTLIGLVIQKRIFARDVRPGQSRFSVPVRQVRTEFLTEEEKWKLNDENLSVILIQLETIKMNTKTWVMAEENGKAGNAEEQEEEEKEKKKKKKRALLVALATRVLLHGDPGPSASSQSQVLSY